MQINTLSATYAQNNALNRIQATEKNNDIRTIKESSTKNTTYDVTNMSPNELGSLIQELQEKGVISDKEAMMFAIERIGMEQFGGVSPDTKIDMLAYFKETINTMRNTPGSKGIEIEERSLDILQAIQTRSGTEIPDFV